MPKHGDLVTQLFTLCRKCGMLASWNYWFQAWFCRDHHRTHA